VTLPDATPYDGSPLGPKRTGFLIATICRFAIKRHMDAEAELTQLLEDTRSWASKPANVNTGDIYSSWTSQEALLNELDQHIADARKGIADFAKLYVLYAPTAGLCEISTSEESAAGYMSLAARFDAWYGSVRPKR